MQTVYPTIIDDLLVNPGTGFVSAPNLIKEGGPILDNRSKEVEPYKFTPTSKTWNHPDSGVYYCGGRWKNLEPQEGVYDWSSIDKGLALAKSMGTTALVRVSPYALVEEDDIPAWLRARCPDRPEYPFWRIDPNTTEYAVLWARLVRAFAKRYDGHPLISSVDLAVCGAWGEGAGTEFMDPEKIDLIVSAYIEGFQKTPLQSLLHDPVSVRHIRSYRSKVGFRVDCLGDMGGFHPGEWSHMLDFYPQNIQNFEMGDAWKQGPVVFEACWHMNDWFLQGWDIDYIIDESLKWHITSYNSKGTTVPAPWKDSVTRWVRRMGYRYEIYRMALTPTAAAGGNIQFEMLLANRGVAPCYHNYPPVLLLEGGGKTYTLPLDADIRTWLPDEDLLLHWQLTLPADIAPGAYTARVGFPVKEYTHKTLALAISGRDKDGFYPVGTLIIEGGRA